MRFLCFYDDNGDDINDQPNKPGLSPPANVDGPYCESEMPIRPVQNVGHVWYENSHIKGYAAKDSPNIVEGNTTHLDVVMTVCGNSNI